MKHVEALAQNLSINQTATPFWIPKVKDSDEVSESIPSTFHSSFQRKQTTEACVANRKWKKKNEKKYLAHYSHFRTQRTTFTSPPAREKKWNRKVK